MATSGPERIDLGEDDGFLIIVVAGVEQQVDLFETNNRFFDFHEKNKNRPDAEYNEGLCGLIEGMGFPRLSHKLALAFYETITKKIIHLKNGHAAPPG